MNTQSKRAEVVDEVSKWGVGLGVVLVALFPLSIPILLLTAVALLPLAVPLIAVAILAVPIVLGRRLVARLIAWNARRRSAAPTGPSTTATSTRSSSSYILKSTGQTRGRVAASSAARPFATTGRVSSARSRATSSPRHSHTSPTAR